MGCETRHPLRLQLIKALTYLRRTRNEVVIIFKLTRKHIHRTFATSLPLSHCHQKNNETWFEKKLYWNPMSLPNTVIVYCRLAVRLDGQSHVTFLITGLSIYIISCKCTCTLCLWSLSRVLQFDISKRRNHMSTSPRCLWHTLKRTGLFHAPKM